MFTGIIEETGTIDGIQAGGNACSLTVRCREVLTGTKIGDSIAVNGVCLTVTTLGSSFFTADVMPETLRRSSLGRLTKNSKVNLERAMPADGRFGGHLVSGHIDGVGSIKKIEAEDNAVIYTILADESLLKYIVEKGSVTVDGISLTVTYAGEQAFQVSTIPHTRTVTNLSEKKAGDIVNLECDIIGKYVDKLMHREKNQKSESGITEEFLRMHGF